MIERSATLGIGIGIGPMEALILLVAGVAVVSLLGRFGGRGVLIAALGAAFVAFMIAVFLANWASDGSYQETVSVTAGDRSYTHSRSMVAVRAKPAPSEPSRSRLELVPTPSDDPPAVEHTSESVTFLPSSAPSWMSLAETSERGDARAVASDGPRPTERECREKIRQEVANHIVDYALLHEMKPLGRRRELLTDQVLEDVVRDEYVTTSPHTFGETEQTWYTLHQLLDYDSGVLEQLAALNKRATGDERLVALGVGGAGLLGVLGLAFMFLKATEKRAPARAVSTEWNVGLNKPDETEGNAGLVTAVAIGVVILIGVVLLMS